MRDFAASRGLALDAAAAALAERLLVAGQKGRHIGGLLGTAVGLTATMHLGLRGPSGLLPFVTIVVPSHVAAALGTGWAMRGAVTASPGDQRFAHAQLPTLDDFLPPVMRWWSAFTLGLSSVLVGISLAVVHTVLHLDMRWLMVAWVAGLASVVATELAARLLVRSPQPAGSPAELAVHDEIKGDLVSVVLFGAVGPSLTCALAAMALAPAAGIVGTALIVAPWALEHRRRHRVRERLWRSPPGGGATLVPDAVP